MNKTDRVDMGAVGRLLEYYVQYDERKVNTDSIYS
jgi:hypothetical protein